MNSDHTNRIHVALFVFRALASFGAHGHTSCRAPVFSAEVAARIVAQVDEALAGGRKGER